MTWEAVGAIATVVIALMLLAFMLTGIATMRTLVGLMGRIEGILGSLDQRVGPTMESARQAADDGRALVARLRAEVDEIADASGRIREKIENGVEAIEERLIDLEALVDVAQTEIEETVLDVTAALRTSRRSTWLLRKIRRALKGRR